MRCAGTVHRETGAPDVPASGPRRCRGDPGNQRRRLQRRPEAPGSRVDQRIGHRKAVGQGEVGGLQREWLVDRRDGCAAEGEDRFHGALLADVASDHLADFVDLDRADQQRLAAFDVSGEAVCVRAAGQIFAPAARRSPPCYRSQLRKSKAVSPAAYNPPETGDIPTSPAVKAILRGAGYDCHSNETEWPYTATGQEALGELGGTRSVRQRGASA
jgi:hypothetical protein